MPFADSIFLKAVGLYAPLGKIYPYPEKKFEKSCQEVAQADASIF